MFTLCTFVPQLDRKPQIIFNELKTNKQKEEKKKHVGKKNLKQVHKHTQHTQYYLN